ncbi:glycoside hydrolase family protein [Citrobacter freundii]|uniref:glycoside hydrolase family protein n=1 Tax=Citrobacter freundii TaxID=546 RepID=UPI00292A7046|nr:glycoside hydrolase family protein [Citrobacter freundii]MDV0678305.1 glycoside hydrolase family protein [Citrobacter freundii]MDV0860797.1 glycoside hydrolase family protein [Citrobacter freundii]MEB0577838.1 glycoside hydrolase family protein [Citrobacter freundii]MEB0714284.1 glycoside hydrolase family protein [Citrobacter freundii]
MGIREKLIKYEGTKQYQSHIGTFRNGKFQVYKCSEGYNTVGYGHLVLQGENFMNGITEDEANTLLDKDIGIARTQVRTLGLDLPPDWEEFMIIMVFQLGIGGVRKFKKMLAALKDKNWKEAIRQAKDSLWYKQTKNRVDEMVDDLINKGA